MVFDLKDLLFSQLEIPVLSNVISTKGKLLFLVGKYYLIYELAYFFGLHFLNRKVIVCFSGSCFCL